MPERQLVSESAVASTWQSQRKWSRAADKFKQIYLRCKALALILSCAGAVLAVASDQMSVRGGQWAKAAHGWVAAASALALTLVPIVIRLGSSRRALERWLRARSMSEQLKSEVYLYLAGAGPYREPSSDLALIARRDDLLEKIADLEPETIGIVAERALPAVKDVSTYIAHRVNDQIEKYYEPKAAYHQHWAVVYRWIEGSLAVVGAAVAATSPIKDNPIAATWVPVLTTVGTAVAAHLVAGRHEQLVPDYLATARRLRSLKERFLAANPNLAAAPTSAVDALVTATEAAISVQSEGWMAEWLKSPTPDAPSPTTTGVKARG
jgi:hypothetical protein